MSEVKRRLMRPLAACLVVGARASRRRLGLALCYHRVADPQGRAGYELVPAMGRSLFAAQLRDLARRYRLVTAGELPEAARARRRGERYPLAVTFDDDLASHVSGAAPILREVGVPATFFIGGGSLDAPRPYFWELLQRAFDTGLAPDDPLLPAVAEPRARGGAHRVADSVRRLERPQREALTRTLLERIGGDPPEPGLREAQLRSLVSDGFELGFHTREHESLDLLDDADLARALRDGRERLETLAGHRLQSIAYPFGAADRRVADAARDAGFQAGFTLAPVPVRPGDDPLLMGRFEPSFTSVSANALEVATGLPSYSWRRR